MAKHKELSEIDREIRASLKEALTEERSRRATEREEFDALLRRLETQLDELGRTAEGDRELLDGVRRALRFGVVMSRNVAMGLAASRRQDSESHLWSLAALLMVRLSIEPDGGIRTLIDGLAQDPDSAPVDQQVMHTLGVLYRLSISLETCAAVAAETVPAAIEHASKNPHANEAELTQALVTRFRERAASIGIHEQALSAT